jgi:hypothetical protein
MKLLPCPFCDGHPVSEQYAKNGWKVQCSKCLVEFRIKVYRFTLQWAKEKCEENWNKRVIK